MDIPLPLFSLLSTTIMESGFLHWCFVPGLYEGPSLCGHGLPQHLCFTMKTNPSPNVGHAADRAYTGSGLTLYYLLVLWPTPSCSHSTDWHVFLQFRFPWTHFYTRRKLTRMKLFLLQAGKGENTPVIITIIKYLGVSPPLSGWMNG